MPLQVVSAAGVLGAARELLQRPEAAKQSTRLEKHLGDDAQLISAPANQESSTGIRQEVLFFNWPITAFQSSPTKLPN